MICSCIGSHPQKNNRETKTTERTFIKTISLKFATPENKGARHENHISQTEHLKSRATMLLNEFFRLAKTFGEVAVAQANES